MTGGSEDPCRWRSSVSLGAILASIVTMAGLALALFLVRQRLRQFLPRLAPYRRRRAQVRRPALVVNPRSGDGGAGRVGLVEQAEQRGVHVLVAELGDDFAALAREAVEDGADALGIAGGDGSLAAVAEVASEHGLPFFVVPVGTRNHFAMDLGLERTDPLAALEALEGEEILIDCGRVNGRLFLNTLSLGLYAEAVQEEGYREHKAETLLSEIHEALHHPGRRPDLRFTTPDGEQHDTAAFVLLSNNPYAWSGPPDFAHRVRLDRGRLGIVAASEHHDRHRPSRLLAKGVGLYEFSADSYRVDAESGEIPAGVDGESVRLEAPVLARVEQQGLRVLVPLGVKPGWLAPPARLAADVLHLFEVASRRDS
jgi:diacylglycerol kinase family enzyme